MIFNLFWRDKKCYERILHTTSEEVYGIKNDWGENIRAEFDIIINGGNITATEKNEYGCNTENKCTRNISARLFGT